MLSASAGGIVKQWMEELFSPTNTSSTEETESFRDGQINQSWDCRGSLKSSMVVELQGWMKSTLRSLRLWILCGCLDSLDCLDVRDFACGTGMLVHTTEESMEQELDSC